MKLLFDQNISFRIISRIIQDFSDSKHVSDVGLAGAEDPDIWQFAKKEGFVIVTFDSDYYDITLIHGCPPKVIWLRTGNLSTHQIAHLLVSNRDALKEFISNPEHKDVACFEIG
jgi:predicted nuclease of predicted toxin-antitoxin system